MSSRQKRRVIALIRSNKRKRRDEDDSKVKDSDNFQNFKTSKENTDVQQRNILNESEPSTSAIQEPIPNNTLVNIITSTFFHAPDKDNSIKNNIRDDLKRWSINHNISRSAMNDLWNILRNNGCDLPADARTLVGTPKSSAYKVIDISDGQYAHFGITAGILKSIKCYYRQPYPNFVKLNFNIDGLPLSKSSGSQFWPILAAVVDEFYTEPFAIGIYHGMKKPEDVNLFLRLFVNDLKEVLNSGVSVDGCTIKVKINAFICDAPVKAFITGVKNHNGYFGCSKCITEGDFINNRITFPDLQSPLRTDETFKNRLQEEHHKLTSVLKTLNFGMASQVPLDYMHLVCLGVVKRMLQFWVNGKINIKLKPKQILEVSDFLKKIK